MKTHPWGGAAERSRSSLRTEKGDITSCMKKNDTGRGVDALLVAVVPQGGRSSRLCYPDPGPEEEVKVKTIAEGGGRRWPSGTPEIWPRISRTNILGGKGKTKRRAGGG